MTTGHERTTYLQQSVALCLLRAPISSSDTRRAHRAVELERRGQTESETAKGRQSYARWCIPLTHSSLSPVATAYARFQRAMLVETLKLCRKSNSVSVRTGCSAREDGAISDAAGGAKASHPVTPCHTVKAIAHRPISLYH